MKTLADTVVERMPLQTRAHIMDEGRHDPAFWPYLTRIAAQPGGATAVDDEMKRAAINELDPTRHRDTRGKWPVLRAKMQYIKGQLAQNARPGFMGPPPAILRHVEGMAAIPGMVTDLESSSDYPSGPNVAPAGEALTVPQSYAPAGAALTVPQTPAPAGAALTAPKTAAPAAGGSDIWGTIGKVLSTAGTAAGQIYATKIQTGAQQDIAKIQAMAAQGIALTQAQQQQLAAARAAAAGGGTSTALYILLGLLGLGGIVLLFSMLSKGRR